MTREELKQKLLMESERLPVRYLMNYIDEYTADLQKQIDELHLENEMISNVAAESKKYIETLKRKE